MQKQQLIELVKRSLQGGDAPAELRGRYHEREIELYLSMAFDAIILTPKTARQEGAQEYGADAWKYDALTKPFTLDIEKDATRDKLFSTLPVNAMSIKDNTGIRMITPSQEESTAFLPRRITDSFLMSGLDVNLLTGMIYYHLEGNKIFYSGDINCDWKQVLARLVLRFEEFEMEDNISIPEGRELEIVQMTIGLMAQKKPADIVNDDAAIQITQ